MPDTRRVASRLVEEGWHSVSRQYRIIARLPEGMSGKEALRWGILEYQRYYENKDRRELYDFEEEWVNRLSDRDAASQFMRVYARYEFAKKYYRELSPAEYKAFRKAGGQPA